MGSDVAIIKILIDVDPMLLKVQLGHHGSSQCRRCRVADDLADQVFWLPNATVFSHQENSAEICVIAHLGDDVVSPLPSQYGMVGIQQRKRHRTSLEFGFECSVVA